MKKVLILGSTGSIGVNTLEVIKEFPNLFKAEHLTTNTNIDLLEEQINKFHPSSVAVVDKEKAKALRNRIDANCTVLDGKEGLLDLTKNGGYDILISALVGFAGLAPTIEAIKRKKRIGLANKETLVAAGEIVINLIKENEAELIPVDSEHSAIFQCLTGENLNEIEKLILTASGGPFLKTDIVEFENITVEQALNHPNWNMGNKISIDSATMMNKGLEIIEAHWLFGLEKDRIQVVVHPQSVVHSMVEFIDGSIKAQLSMPDMKLPIQYALSYPNRLRSNFVNTDFPKLERLTFIEPDLNKFKCLKLAYDALEQGGTASCILNAANEVAVDNFLSKKIRFTQIPNVIEESLNKLENHISPDIETIFECDLLTRESAQNFINKEN
jgi:1-deoxy-D-xylulose-5-phosphate reductoisomerase